MDSLSYIALFIMIVCIAYAARNTAKKLSQNEAAKKFGVSLLDRWLKR